MTERANGPDGARLDPWQAVRQVYGETESSTAAAMERLVGSNSFGELLARVTENVVAVVKIGNDSLDLVVRNLRLAGRQDITRLARQLARTEDKLELVLQEVERLQALLAARDAEDGGSGDEQRGRRSNGGARDRGRRRAGKEPSAESS